MKVETRSVFPWEGVNGSEVFLSLSLSFLATPRISLKQMEILSNKKRITGLAINLCDVFSKIPPPWVAQLEGHFLSSSNGVYYRLNNIWSTIQQW